MVTKTIKTSKREKFTYNSSLRGKYAKTKICNHEKKLEDSKIDYTCAKSDIDNENKRVPQNSSLKYEKENLTKESKPKKFVSFSDDGKTRFTSSIYYGVKSYLHHFYEPLNRHSYNDDDTLLEDDFEFVIEPGRRKSRCWFTICIFVGLALLLLGIVLILVGNLTPPKKSIIGVQQNLEILDQNAIDFNKNIQMCQFSGLIAFCAGGIVIMLTLLISAYERECGCHNIRNQALYPSLIDSNAWIRCAEGHSVSQNRIPLSAEIKAVQTEKGKD